MKYTKKATWGRFCTMKTQTKTLTSFKTWKTARSYNQQLFNSSICAFVHILYDIFLKERKKSLTEGDDRRRALTATAPTAAVRQVHTMLTPRMMLLVADMVESDVVIRIHRHSWNTHKQHIIEVSSSLEKILPILYQKMQVAKRPVPPTAPA